MGLGGEGKGPQFGESVQTGSRKRRRQRPRSRREHAWGGTCFIMEEDLENPIILPLLPRALGLNEDLEIARALRRGEEEFGW